MLVFALLTAPRPLQGYILIFVVLGHWYLARWAYVKWRRRRAQSGTQQQEKKEAKFAHRQGDRLFTGILGSIMLIFALLTAPRPFQGYMLIFVVFGPGHLAYWAYVKWRRRRAQSGTQQQED